VNRLDDSVPLDPEHRRKAVQDLADHQLAPLVAVRFVVIASDTFDDGDVLEALAHLDTHLIHDVAEGRFSADRRSSPVAAQSLMALAQYGVAAAIESYGEHVGPSLGKVPAVNVEVALRPGENQLLDVEKLVEADKARLYVCGPGGFMNWVLGTAEACMPHDRIHRESFAAAPIEAPTDEGFEVEIASTGQRFFIPTDKSVAAVLEEAGIEVLVSCQQGICGSCITNILEGEPDHKDSVLSESERKSGKLFTPCCSRAKSAKLVLDI